MVGSKGKGRASVSKSNSNNLALVCADPESLKCSVEESADDPLDGKEENNREGANSTGEEMRDEIICGLVVGNGCEEEQLANQVNDEAKDAANEINDGKTEDVPLSGRTEAVSQEVIVGGDAASNVDVPENEERINEVAPEEDKERMHDGVGNNNTEGGEEKKSSEAAVEGKMNIDEGLCASEHGIMEERLTDNMQDEEANKVNAEEPVGTPTNNGQIESTDQDVSIANDVKSVPEKVDRPKRKVLKRKVVKKKIVVRDEAKSQSLSGNEASGEADKADTDEAVKNEEKAVPEDTSEAGEDRKSSEVDVEGNVNIDEGLCASEHGVMEEMLMDNLQNEEANKVNAEEPMGSPTDNGKIECMGEDVSITNEAKSVLEKTVRPKRKVLKKKVVKKKMVVQDDVASMEENRLGALTGNEASGEADIKDTNEDVKSEEKAVSADHGKIESTGEDASTAGNVKVDPEKANGPKRKVLKKKVVKKKVVLGDAVAAANEAKPECSIDNDASGEANKADTNKDVKNDEKAEIKPAVRAKRKRVRKKVPKGQTNITTAGGEQKPKVTNDEAGNKKNEETVGQDLKNGEAVASGVRVTNVKKRKRKKVVKEDTQKVVDANNNPGPSEKSKSSERTDSMGMIFMCSSETKKDCYRYKVLGLPAGKKDNVLKIYKGMRLFLFDVDQRMMYGIYKAAGPGGYNIEPRAFNRQFPSQVRFTVLKDCLPLAEEKFKTAINDNYYTKNKFNCLLSNEQVKNLCKLFTETSKRAESKPVARTPRTQIPAVPSSSSHRDRKRKRAEETRRSGRNDRRKSGRTDSRISSAELERSRRRRAHEEVRRAAPIIIDDRYHHHHLPVVYDYERESYLPPTLPATVYQHLPSQSYTYDYGGASSRVEDIYRRVDSGLEHRRVDLPRSSREWEHSVANVDIPYVPYRETQSYREPPYETTRVRREAEYGSGSLTVREPPYETTRVRREAEYESASLSVRPTEYYRVSDSYRAPLPPYRRY